VNKQENTTADPFDYATLRHAMRVVFNAEPADIQPFIDLPFVEAHRYAENLPDTPDGRRLALRSLLRKSIEALRPSWDEPDYLDPSWRPYLILHEQFLRKKAVDALADQMALSRSAYFREQRQALLELANLLRERNREAQRPQATPSVAGPSAPYGGRPLHNLPFSLTSFIGRQAELRQIAGYLDDPACRLLCLAGLGGSGKTRLALQVGHSRVGAYRDGVFFMPLADLDLSQADSARLSDFLADHLLRGLQSFLLGGSALRSVDRSALLELLRDKEMLLILDNFESVIESAPLLSAMLSAGPELTILVTSRQRLRVEGEWIIDVHGLPLPDDAHAPDAASSDAVQLFVRSAQSVQPGFVLSPADLPYVVAVCRLVDGLPLGIELAAAWTRALTCAEIYEQITADMLFLTSAQRDALPHQRSIGVILDYSWSILDSTEQELFAQMSVFQGSFDLAAAVHVIGAAPTLLASLVDKSLLLHTRAGRFSLHPLLRQYAAGRLYALPNGENAVRARHADYFAGFLRQRQQDLLGDHAAETLRTIQEDLENIRAGWQWASHHAEVDVLARSQDALADYYDITGLIEEGERAFRSAADGLAARIEASETPSREWQILLASLLAYQSYFLQMLAQFDRLTAAAAQSLALAQALQAPEVEARCYLNLGLGLFWKDKLSEARRYLQHAQALAEAIGDLKTVAQALQGLALIANREVDSPSAILYAEEALRIERSLGRSRGAGLALLNLGVVHGGAGNYEVGNTCFVQALEIGRTLGDPRLRARALGNLGTNQLALGQGSEAHDSFVQALHILARAGDRRAQATYLLNLGRTAIAMGDFPAARDWIERGLDIVYSIPGLANTEVHLTIVHGHSLLGLGDLEGAQRAYEQALQLATAVQQPYPAVLARGGLAQVALRRGDKPLAMSHVEAVLEQLDFAAPDRFLDSVMDPFQLLLSCYEVLDAALDSRAADVLAVARTGLQARAALISDAGLRRSFLVNVPTHQKLLRLNP
jgi:predicted ATPase/Flp pilus assembly protein TadD